MVDGPGHVKKLTLPQLQELAGEIREELIAGLAKGGGHLGPNLGVVELTLALHKVFTTPKDKFVWDVSHQVYVHKILTGRKGRFRTIRQTDGLNGFALRTETIVFTLGAQRKTVQSIRLANSSKTIFAAGQNFVDINLMAHVPDKFVLRRGEDAM